MTFLPDVIQRFQKHHPCTSSSSDERSEERMHLVGVEYVDAYSRDDLREEFESSKTQLEDGEMDLGMVDVNDADMGSGRRLRCEEIPYVNSIAYV